ncbi:MAG: alpha/beta fold hydrolase [Vicinamibacteraceae bacterium]
MRKTMKSAVAAMAVICVPAPLMAVGVADTATGRYAAVNGLKMYYEVHGTGQPIVLLHGGLATIDTTYAQILPALAKTRRVVAVEFQGHGHTPDADREITVERFVEDVAALLGQLEIDRADFMGYSFGGMVSLGTAIRHPTLVDRLILVGTPNSIAGLEPPIQEGIRTGAAGKSKPEDVPAPLREAYAKVAPDPQRLPIVGHKMTKALAEFPGWRLEDLRALRSPVMFIVGDRDFVRPEHAVELFRLVPNAQLTMLPNAGHDAIVERSKAVLAVVTPFLEAPAAARSRAPSGE